jgi:hypothetical protein
MNPFHQKAKFPLIIALYFMSLLPFVTPFPIKRMVKPERNAKRKAPKGTSEPPWSLHLRSFWKILFINPPEGQDPVVRVLTFRQGIDDAKIPKFPIWVNRKIAGYAPRTGQRLTRYNQKCKGSPTLFRFISSLSNLGDPSGDGAGEAHGGEDPETRCPTSRIIHQPSEKQRA